MQASERPKHASAGDKVIPGDYLGCHPQFTSGPCTYRKGSDIFSSLVGYVRLDQSTSQLSVKGRRSFSAVPSIGSVVIGRVLNISERQAKMELIGVNERLLQEPLNGLIRKEDVREMEKDSVDMFASFRPGDIVRARVITLGESHYTHYGLTTASNELGVVMATSERGHAMGPVSWSEMQCVKTGVRETRKVAKVKDALPA